jgi:hypothetical protein
LRFCAKQFFDNHDEISLKCADFLTQKPPRVRKGRKVLLPKLKISNNPGGAALL